MRSPQNPSAGAMSPYRHGISRPPTLAKVVAARGALRQSVPGWPAADSGGSALSRAGIAVRVDLMGLPSTFGGSGMDLGDQAPMLARGQI
jgi:hypothetical protein